MCSCFFFLFFSSITLLLVCTAGYLELKAAEGIYCIVTVLPQRTNLFRLTPQSTLPFPSAELTFYRCQTLKKCWIKILSEIFFPPMSPFFEIARVAINIQTFQCKRFQHRKKKSLGMLKGKRKMSPGIFCGLNDKMMPTGNNIVA